MANLVGSELAEENGRVTRRKGLPKNIDHTPHIILSISVTSLDKILAKLNLNNSGQVPTDLDDRLSALFHSWSNVRTVTNGCNLVMSNEDDASM
jgi:hypothetical protein